ncbi:hypothetical protein BGX38DRAFT_881175 [Terfezia claveryi]|nr:hypothetical protein BGX38DRAFT_881175 [Terfezia claveryi]
MPCPHHSILFPLEMLLDPIGPNGTLFLFRAPLRPQGTPTPTLRPRPRPHTFPYRLVELCPPPRSLPPSLHAMEINKICQRLIGFGRASRLPDLAPCPRSPPGALMGSGRSDREWNRLSIIAATVQPNQPTPLLFRETSLSPQFLPTSPLLQRAILTQSN